MELDKRLVEYASVILNDANRLLSDNSNLSPRQRVHIERIVRASGSFIEYYNQCMSALAIEVVLYERRRLEQDMGHELGGACTTIKLSTFMVKKLEGSTLNWTETHLSLLVNIEHNESLIWTDLRQFGDYLIAIAQLR